jgi:hypothetical protein
MLRRVPPYPAAPKTLRVALRHTWGVDADVLTRFFISYAGTAPAVTELATFNGVVAGAWGSHLSTLAPTGVELVEVETIDLSSPTASVDTTTTSQAGSRGTTSLTAGTALVASYTILRRYRGGHPRGYWPFGVEADLQDPQDWTAGFLTACSSGLDAFFSAVLLAPWSGGGPLTQANVSYYAGFTVITSPTTGRARNVPTLRGAPTIDLVTGIVPRPRVGSQRRRNEA